MLVEKTYIIDPLTTLCKIALLHFLPTKTRISINNHVLQIQESTYFQWLERKKNGDNRFDVSNLNTPIIKAIKWYIIDNSEKIQLDDITKESIITIVQFTIRGMTKLQNYTYSNDISIRIILQYFINILQDSLNGILDESKCVLDDNRNGILSDKIKNNIDFQTINTIAKNLSDAEKLQNSREDVDAIIDCVHKILINRDIHFVKLMKDVNTYL